MFDLSWTELVIIGIIALLVIGPKELPGVLRSVGHWMGKIRRMASDFQGQFHEAMREAEMADLKKQVDDLSDTTRNLTSQYDPFTSIQNDIDETFSDKKKSAEGSRADFPEEAQVLPPAAETEPARQPDQVAREETEPRAEPTETPPPRAAVGGHAS